MLNYAMIKDLYPAQLFPEMQLGKYRFILRFKKKIKMPTYHGAALRGLLGHSLIEIECPFRKQECKICSSRHSCSYYKLYESSSNENGFTSLPRPYIIYPAGINTIEYSSFLNFDMTLIGNAGDTLPSLITAWENAGNKGLIKRDSVERFVLHKVMRIFSDNAEGTTIFHEDGICSYDHTVSPLADYLTKELSGTLLKVYISTPLRLRDNGKNLDNLDWNNAFQSLAIRLSILNRYYCNGKRTPPEQWKGLMEVFRKPGKSYDSNEWKDIRRYSSRQNAHILMGGIYGESIIEPPKHTLELWWQWWQTASLFHLGKGITMGLGKVHPVFI